MDPNVNQTKISSKVKKTPLENAPPDPDFDNKLKILLSKYGRKQKPKKLIVIRPEIGYKLISDLFRD